MRYQDFLLHLDATPQGRGVVRLVRSPAGEAEGTFDLAPFRDECRRYTEELTRMIAAGRSRRGAVPFGAVPVPSLLDLGDRLFQAVFSPPIRSRYDECLGQLGANTGLRITLQIGLGDAAREVLHALPWECLYQADSGTFLARGRRTPVVRHLALPVPGRRPPVAPPLRVLTVASEPSDLPVLEIAREAAAMEALGGRALRATRLPVASLAALREALLSGEVHALHFLGHGDARGGEGVLFFTGADGRAVAVGARELAAHLDVPSLRLVVLNACQTAQTGNSGADRKSVV